MTDALRSTECPDPEVLEQMLEELLEHRPITGEDKKHYDNCMDILAELQGRLETANELGMSLSRLNLLERYNEAADHLARAGLNLYNFERQATEDTETYSGVEDDVVANFPHPAF